jgi:RNA polymerase sigma-70 factor (ECF subfamily)
VPHDESPEPIDQVVRALIRRKANQLIGRAGLTRQDREDLEQELLRLLLQRLSTIDQQRARTSAFLATVIERLASNLLRDRRAAKRDGRRTSSLNVPASGEDAPAELVDTITRREQEARRGRHPRGDEELAQLASDVAEVLAGLPADLRALAERLMSQSVSQAARELGVARTSLYGDIRRLRRRFERAGLKDYL